MPASDTVPSPLKFFGRIPGTPGELTYAKDIERYYQELAKTSPRVKFWKLGTTEEGRDQVVIAIADEATLKNLDKYKAAPGGAGRSAQDHAGAGQGRRSRPPSRSTGSPAASTRRRPAGRRC